MTYPRIKIIKDERDSSVKRVKENQLLDLKGLQLEIRSVESVLGGTSFFLPDVVNSQPVTEWIIVRDNYGITCLVPLKKK